MKELHSADGTKIAVDVIGSGPALVLVDGAFAGRTFGPMPAVAKHMAAHMTVFHYDRRGRGGSGDTAPYAVEREIEDLAAVCALAGSAPSVYATSSGSALALRAAGSGVGMSQLVIYEPPMYLDGTWLPNPKDFRERIATLLAKDQRDDAVKLFMSVVGVPAFGIWMMRMMPNVWPHLRAAAHTLPYDFAALGDSQRGGPLPEELRVIFARISAPTHVLVGGKSPAWMQHSAQVVSDLIPRARLRVVPGQTHTISTKAITRELSALVQPPSAAEPAAAHPG